MLVIETKMNRRASARKVGERRWVAPKLAMSDDAWTKYVVVV